LQTTNPGLDSWSISFAGNSLGLVYTAKSKAADQITVDNWYKLLVEQHTRYSRVDPDTDPLGYWTLISWVLAQNYYKQAKLARELLLSCPKTNVQPKESDLLAMLQRGELDYFFAYRSDAMNPNLRFLRLPPEIGLGDQGLAQEYSTVTIGLGPPEHKRDVVGAPIAYAVTLPAQAPNHKAAAAFLQFMFGQAGRNIGVNSGLILYNQPIAYKAGKEFPQALFKLVKFAP
jgi:molybdate/tungstate transport system substrate-binding protein